MRLIDKLEAAIKAGSWKDVCIVYKQMTGKTIEPPNIVTEPVFDINTASKTEIYKRLKKSIELGPIKEYSVEDLRDIWVMHNEPQVEEQNNPIASVEEVENVSVNPEFTFTSAKKRDKIINIDKKKLKPRFTEFPSYGDEGKSKIERDRKQELVRVPCRKCKTMSDVHPSLVIHGLNNDKSYICPKCS